MVNINKNEEWKQYKRFMENEFKRMGEYVRITRAEKDEFGYTSVVLEKGLNVSYNIPNREVEIWGTSKGYLSGYISYEKLVEKVELFKKLMEEVTCG